MNILSTLKKGLAGLTLAAMAVTIAPAAAFASVEDFTDSAEIPSWANEAIEELMDQGVINGNGDGSFAPNAQLNRAEVSKIIVLATGVEFDTDNGAGLFSDINQGDWFYDYVITMANYGWINGYPDGRFRPGVGINRAEIAKMVVNSFELDNDTTGAPHFDDVAESDWFYGYVETVYNNGLIAGYADGTFSPNGRVTRAETVKIVYDAQLLVAAPVGPAEGTLEVALSADTPRGTNIPYNATSVPYITVELTSSDDADVEVSSLTFTRLGLGDNDDFDNVWLEIDGFKVGNDKSVNNDDITELRFNPPIVVPAGQTLVADVVTSAKYTATDKNVGHHNRFALVSADDIASTAANIVGDFPIEGEEMEIADYEVSELSFSTLGSDTTIDVGDNFIEIGKFRLLNDSNTNKDVELRALTFKNDGTAQLADVLENVALYVSGEQVSAETIIDGDYITFRLDNGVTGGYVIEDGDSRIFSMRADIVSAEQSDNINFKVDNFEDVVAIEIGTSFGVKAVSTQTAIQFANGTTSNDTGTTCSDAEDNCARLRAYQIDSGDLNVSRDPSSLGNQQYAPGSNDVVFLTARLIVDQPLITDGVTLYASTESTLPATATTLQDSIEGFNFAFDNFRLYLNDSLVDSENDFTGTAGALVTTTNALSLEFDTTFEIAGTSILKLVANVTDGAPDGGKLKLTLDANDFQSVEYISTGDQVSGDELLGSAEGSFVEITDSTLTITKTDGLADGETIVGGVNDVTFAKFVLDNNDSGDINVTSVTISTERTGSARDAQNFTAAIFVDGTQQGSSKNLDTNGDATFNDLSVIIQSAGQKEFTVVVNTIEASADTFSETVRTDPAISTADATANDTIDVSDAFAAALTVGDTVSINDTTGPLAETEAVVTAITTTAGAGDFTYSAAAAIDYTATATVTLKHTIRFDVEAVDADNVENGQTVEVQEGGAVLATANPLTGTEFELVESGTLTVTNKLVNPETRLMVAGQKDFTVAQINFNASDDMIEVKDLYVANVIASAVVPATPTATTISDATLAGTVRVGDILRFTDVADGSQEEATITSIATPVITFSTIAAFADYTAAGLDTYEHIAVAAGERVDFKLYDEAGQLIQTKQMTNGKLHFELANSDRISVPKDATTFVTIKVDVRDITRSNQTGKRLQLALNTAGSTTVSPFKGIEAVTAATGSDIAAPTAGWTDGTVSGDEYIAYRTKIEFANATNQPTFQTLGATPSGNPIFRFMASADSAFQATLDKISVGISSSDVFNAGADANPVNCSSVTLYRYSSSAFTGSPTQVGTTSVNNGSSAECAISFTNTEEIAAGGTNYYELRTTEAITNNAAQDDSITVSFFEDAGYVAPNTDRANAILLATDNKIVWSDRSNNGGFGPYLNGFELVYPNQADGASE